MDKDAYNFVRLCDVHLPLTVRIASLQGRTLPPEDLYLTVRLFADNKPLTPIYQTAYRPTRKLESRSTSSSRPFEETLVLPIRLSQLPLLAQLTFTVWRARDPDDAVAEDGRVQLERVVGGTTMRLFGKKGTLKRASHRLYLWPDVEGDGSAETTTPSKIAGGGNRKKDEMARLEKLIKLHERSELPKLQWLDNMAWRQIEKVNNEESLDSTDMYLYVDYPRFDAPIVYCEQESAIVTTSASAGDGLQAPVSSTIASDVPSTPAGAANGPGAVDAGVFTIFDGDMVMERENPVEAKHRRLVRSHRSGPLDRELKPNAGVRDELNEILSYPPTRTLTASESDLLWSFRFYLTRIPSGLTKFLKSVSWNDQGEAKQATEILMPMWSDIGMDDALELLGPGFRDARVRAYAVRMLERADDDELMLYLLQLVQALKFDRTAVAPATLRRDPTESISPSASIAHPSPSASSSTSVEGARLADFLTGRAVKNPVLGNNLYWYLVVECEDRRFGKMYKRVLNTFLDRLDETTEGSQVRELLQRQAEMVKVLSVRAKELRTSKDARPKKIDKLRAFIGDAKNGLRTIEPPMLLPLDARVSISGVTPEKSSVFKSNLFPLLLHFERTDGENAYPVIFKNGDDMRQDQLVVQLFTLMDRLLRNENLDLCLTPYKVLATGALEGMAQYVDSITLAAVLAQHGGSLLNFLRHHHPDESSTSTFGVNSAVFDTYIRSCAGYCVVTYLLGVGDRHLDNLLLAPDGHFFHVDFGYILGRDPKPFSPPVKVAKEMVDAMGGSMSPHYTRFKKLCHTAFTSLRKNSNLILNLIALMVDANVPDIRFEPDKAVLKVQERFRLDLSEEDAMAMLEELLNNPSYITIVFDRLHDAAQYFRS